MSGGEYHASSLGKVGDQVEGVLRRRQVRSMTDIEKPRQCRPNPAPNANLQRLDELISFPER